MLTTMMEKQSDLQQRLGIDFSRMTLEERAAYMRDQRGYLADEVAEALYEMPFYKTWKDYSTMAEGQQAIAWQKVRMELIDAMHFFMNLLLCAGFTADEVYSMYMAKNKENHRRQDSGYTADVSYREQSVEDVMKEESRCTVRIDGTHTSSDDFIACLCKDGGIMDVFYNTDALTLGLAAKRIDKLFNKALEACSEEETKMIQEVLDHE